VPVREVLASKFIPLFLGLAKTTVGGLRLIAGFVDEVIIGINLRLKPFVLRG